MVREQNKKEGVAVPNIEIHGRNNWSYALVEIIHSLLDGKHYADDVVVTICQTDIVFDPHMKEQPFLRLITTSDGETTEIIKLLQTLGMDIEHIVAVGFYPAKKH